MAIWRQHGGGWAYEATAKLPAANRPGPAGNTLLADSRLAGADDLDGSGNDLPGHHQRGCRGDRQQPLYV